MNYFLKLILVTKVYVPTIDNTCNFMILNNVNLNIII